MSVLKEIMIFNYFAIFLAAILFYANYLKLPKADSEPTKIFFKLGTLANKIHCKKNLRPQNKVIGKFHFWLPDYQSCEAEPIMADP